MSAARIEALEGKLQLGGVLDYSSAPALREQGRRLIAAHKAASLSLDCSAVTHSSSVGLALLLAFMRDAKECGKTLTLCHLPYEMQQIAQVSGITALLGLAAL